METKNNPIHPLGNKARVLLSSVFGPYAQDDEFGSRKINPMELYHNQVTRVQGGFSLRMFHRSFGLIFIQANIDAPCTLIDFPSLDRFIQEIQQNPYDIIGISSIIPNVGKVREMCEVIRQYQPNATIVVGGHVANKGGLEDTIEVDYVVKGDGIRWFRQFLGQDQNMPVQHPAVLSASFSRMMGHTLSDEPDETAAILIPSVGCPMGCNFCSTSALFGGKGKFVNFYDTGDELFKIMCDIENRLGSRSFFVLDENFLFHRKRALRLLELIKENNKSWMLNVFSSARVIQSYTIEQLVEMGIGWIWMGLEGKDSRYRKLNDAGTHDLVDSLQAHGIRVLGSSIIGLENHTPDNMDQVIDYAVRHDTVFHQFMLYTPNEGTPLYEEHKKDESLYDESTFPIADAHGQYRFNYRHQHIHGGQEEKFLLDAFNKDFESNGPSLIRLIKVLLDGWKRYKNHPDKCIRNRYEWEVSPLKATYAGAVWAMKRWYRGNKKIQNKAAILLQDIYGEFGWKTRFITPLIGSYTYFSLKKEEKRLEKGWTIEPEMFYEKNNAALALEQKKPVLDKKRKAQENIATQVPALTR